MTFFSLIVIKQRWVVCVIRWECSLIFIAFSYPFSHATKKSSQVISSFQSAKEDPFDNMDTDLFQRVWSNSNFQLKIAEKFGKYSVLVRNEVFNNGFRYR